MNAIYHLNKIPRFTGILMPLGLTFRLPPFTRAISCNSLQPKRDQESWKSYPTQTNAQLFTSIVFESNIENGVLKARYKRSQCT